MPDHLLVERTTTNEQGHGLEKIEYRLGFKKLTVQQVFGGIDALRPFVCVKEVAFQSK